MTVAPGLLDRRLIVYAQEDGGADGFARPVYVRTGEWWGRLDDTADTETVPLSPQNHVEYRTAASATVADYVPVPRFGVIRESGGETLYAIRGVIQLRALRCQRITLEAIQPTDYGLYDLYDDTEVLDGVHLITGPTAFSSAFFAPEFA